MTALRRTASALLSLSLMAPVLPAVAQEEGRQAKPGAPSGEEVLPRRFGQRAPDEAFGAFQRGMYLTALNLAKPRAEAGDKAAQVLIADIYSRGLGVKRDDVEAAKWYRLAAEQGQPDAQFQYALMLLDGRGVTKDIKQAHALMEEAANAGNRLAQFNFAQILLAGQEEPSPELLARATDLYEKAADQNLADAQYAMAQVYAEGVGGRQKDENRARALLHRAAMQDYDTAELEFAQWLIDGRGGPPDAKAGFSWMKKAAEGGNVAAQNRLAKLYVEGIGNDGDPILGAAWYMVAHKAGLTDAYMEDHLRGLTDAQHEQAYDKSATLR